MKFVECAECHEVKPHVAKQLCQRCYIRLYMRRKRPPYIHAPIGMMDRYCVICLELFRSIHSTQKLCSYKCIGIMKTLRSYRSLYANCQRCQRFRLIRSKKLCSSCYVLSRGAMNRMGIYGACSSKINRLAYKPLDTESVKE